MPRQDGWGRWHKVPAIVKFNGFSLIVESKVGAVKPIISKESRLVVNAACKPAGDVLQKAYGQMISSITPP